MRVQPRRGRLVASAMGVAAVLPGLLGCSVEDDAEAAPAASTAAVRTALVDLFAGDRPSASDVAAAECFADDLLGRVTPADLRDGGVLGADYAPRAEVGTLDRTVAEAWTDAQLACTDFVEESTQAQQDLSRGRLDADRYAGCLRDRLDEQTIRDASVSTLMARWEDPAVAEMSAAQAGCSAAAGAPTS